MKIFILIVLFLLPALALGQLKCELPNVYGVASIRANRPYLAVWRHTDQEERLDIYEGLQCLEASRVAHFEERAVRWQSISAIEDFAELGFRVRTQAGEGWFGGTKLFMYDGKRFLKAFDSGEISEVADLDGDGNPEVIEFLQGKGHPAGKVRVWIWQNDKFDVLTTTIASDLYSAKLIGLLSSKSRAVTKRDNP